MTAARRTVWRMLLAAACALALSGVRPAAGAEQKLSFAVPGVPPVFGSVVVYVAKEEGFFKKHGVDVDVRPFDSGAAAAQAVVAGNPDVALSPTPVIVRMISNAGVNLVGIYGLEHPDWLLASTDPFVEEVRRKLQNFSLPNVETILAGKDTQGPHIYVLIGSEIICADLVGFGAIGSGIRVGGIFDSAAKNLSRPVHCRRIKSCDLALFFQ